MSCEPPAWSETAPQSRDDEITVRTVEIVLAGANGVLGTADDLVVDVTTSAGSIGFRPDADLSIVTTHSAHAVIGEELDFALMV